MLGCTPQADNTCVCPDLRWSKKLGGSNRDISALMDGGAHTSEARSWSVYWKAHRTWYPGLRLVSPPGVWMAMYPVGGPRDWPLASLTGPRGSPGPQTPGSQPACDTGRKRLSARLLWRLSGDFSDSDSEDFEEAEGRYFRVRGAPLGRGPEPASLGPVLCNGRSHQKEKTMHGNLENSPHSPRLEKSPQRSPHWVGWRGRSLSLSPASGSSVFTRSQTHVHRVGDAIQPSHPLLSPSPPALNLFQHQRGEAGTSGFLSVSDSARRVKN